MPTLGAHKDAGGGAATLPTRLVAEIESALVERQALLSGPDADTPLVRGRIDSIGARLQLLLDSFKDAWPPQVALDDQTDPQGNIDRFFNHGDAERRAG